MSGLRIGRISAVNYTAGTARILYKDKSEEVTREVPLLSAEYCMPEVDDLVLAAHLPNGKEAAVILGRFWSDKNKPPEGKKGLYRKDFSRTKGKAVLRYAEDEDKAKAVFPNFQIQTRELRMDAEKVTGNGVGIGFAGKEVMLAGSASITITGGNAKISGNSVEISGGTVTITGGNISISGAGDVVVDGISLKNHTHTCSTSGSLSSKPI